jgi:hypothetical protein
LYDICFRPEDVRDGVGAVERWVGRFPPSFRKIGKIRLLSFKTLKESSTIFVILPLLLPLRDLLDQGPLFDSKLLPPRHSVTAMLERYSKCPIQKSPCVSMFSQ